MAGAWLIRLAILILNISLITLLVMANTDFCGSVFETEVGKQAQLNLNVALSFYSVCLHQENFSLLFFPC